jgi:hypothetical protein
MIPIANRPELELWKFVRALNGVFEPEQILGPADALRRERRIKETPPLLRKLVERWQSSGPDVSKFADDNPQEWKDVTSQFQKGMELNPIRLMGAPGGGVGLAMNSNPQPEPYDEALRLFIQLLLNPECSRLAGPCDRCGNYYIRGSAKNKIYCSRFCGTRATAIAATNKKRQMEADAKLKRAARTAQKWLGVNTKLDWKTWVNQREPDITTNFLTRAVTKGKLKEPRRQTSKI